MRTSPQTIIGHSEPLSAALEHVSRLALIDRPVLITGERGTGKELAGERLHFLSPRWSSALVKINCGALTETLLESELFGHEAGAFTGASRQHKGHFERADGGTLFLDELGTMSLRLQEKLLRLIEYGEFERVGGHKTLQVDVRVVAATHADLPAMAERNAFRWDLLDRLSFDVVRLPALRERPEDIEALAEHFAIKFSAELGWPLFPGFTQTALERLCGHDWPGNVRELKNAVERSIHRWGEHTLPIDNVVLNPFGEAHKRDVPNDSAAHTATASPVANTRALPIDLRQWQHEAERDWLIHALEATQFHQKEAAQALGLSYDQLRNLVRKHRLRSRAPRGTHPEG